MNDSMLMQAASQRRELTREAGQARLAAGLRGSRPTSLSAQAKRRLNSQGKAHAGRPSPPRRPGSWLATAVARLRPTIAGR
jgi:hypothetical protein